MTKSQQIAADYAFSLECPEEFLGYDGRVAISIVMRTVAALNPEVTRKEFVAASVALGYNANTVAIQFNKSRKLTLEDDGVTLNDDGSLTVH
jgi:hypothetical protein